MRGKLGSQAGNSPYERRGFWAERVALGRGGRRWRSPHTPLVLPERGESLSEALLEWSQGKMRVPKTKLLQLGCARGRQCFGNLLLECHQPRSAQLWMDAGARRVFFGRSVALVCGEIVTNSDQRKTTGLQSASS